MDEAVQTLTADSGSLRRVAGVRSGEGYALLDLVFDRGTLRLACDADTDQILVSACSDEPPSNDSVPVGNDPALASLIGKIIEQAWTMLNDRGYADAFQIRCLDLATRETSCCQFEVAAAAITLARVGV